MVLCFYVSHYPLFLSKQKIAVQRFTFMRCIEPDTFLSNLSWWSFKLVIKTSLVTWFFDYWIWNLSMMSSFNKGLDTASLYQENIPYKSPACTVYSRQDGNTSCISIQRLWMMHEAHDSQCFRVPEVPGSPCFSSPNDTELFTCQSLITGVGEYCCICAKRCIELCEIW